MSSVAVQINAGREPVTAGTHAGPVGSGYDVAERLIPTSGVTKQRRDQLVIALANAVGQASPAILDALLMGFTEPVPALSSKKARTVAALTGGRQYSEGERHLLHAASEARAFARRRELLADTLTTAEVAALLRTTRQTPHDRAAANRLLALRDGGQLRFPRWQFDPEGPDGVLDGLPKVLEALNVSAFAKAAWLTSSQPALGGRTPLEALGAGEIDSVVRLAAAVGVA